MTSKIILGTAQLGMDYGINNQNGKISKNEAFDILDLAFENEIYFLDTAPVYGEAHNIIGKFHKANPSKKFNIITKIPSGFQIKNLEELVDNFLKELNIDNIDVLHFHSINDYINADFNKMEFIFNSLKKSQKVQLFGVSIYDNHDVECIEKKLIDVVQIPFNLLDNLNLRGNLLQNLKNNNFIVHARSVFLQGLFFKEINNIEYKEISDSIFLIKQLCNKYDVGIEELALGYSIYQSNIDKTLIGIDNIDHLKRNLAILNKKSKIDFIDFINDIRISDISKLNPSKWKIK
jgi:aryl-alcohol dehydrogenase-like predicted oxidoreductase